MKKVIISSCILLFLSCFNSHLNLSNSVMASALACIEDNEHVAKIISDPNKLDAKLQQIKKQVLTLILINSTLQEKLQLKDFTKSSSLLAKLLSELIVQGSKTLDVELDKIQALIINLNINNLNQIDITHPEKNNAATQNTDPVKTQELTEKISTLCGEKLYLAIQKIAQFFHIKAGEELTNKKKQVKELLNKTLKTLSPAELKRLEDMISKPAFEKVINLLDEATEITIRILSDN